VAPRIPGCRIGALPAVVRDPEALPANVFDEWYIFSSAAPEKTLKRFLNYEWFTLGPAQVVISGTISPGT